MAFVQIAAGGCQYSVNIDRITALAWEDDGTATIIFDIGRPVLETSEDADRLSQLLDEVVSAERRSPDTKGNGTWTLAGR